MTLALWQWLTVFVAAGVVLTRAGVVLTRAGDALAEVTGISRLVLGMVLVALATSLPEVVTDVSAGLADAPDLAVGDLFGSSMANMAILGLVDLWHRGRLWPLVELGHARVASVAIALTALAALGVLTPTGVTLGWVGLDTIVVAVAYLAAVAWIRREPLNRPGGILPTPTGWVRPPRGALRPTVIRFAAGAAVILVAAPVVAYSGREIAESSGLGEGFVGAALVAVSTSLPELVASIAAVRIGAHDLAVGNLFGSNAVNMAVLVLVDVAYTRGSLLAAVDVGQAVAASSAILLMALAMAALVQGAEARIRRLEPDAILLLLAYVGGLVAVWAVRP